MKWNTIQLEWKPWFAWYPVYFANKEGRLVTHWLERVERREVESGWDYIWEYRELNG